MTLATLIRLWPLPWITWRFHLQNRNCLSFHIEKCFYWPRGCLTILIYGSLAMLWYTGSFTFWYFYVRIFNYWRLHDVLHIWHDITTKFPNRTCCFRPRSDMDRENIPRTIQKMSLNDLFVIYFTLRRQIWPNVWQMYHWHSWSTVFNIWHDHNNNLIYFPYHI
jgi:hypothetical protein